MKIATILLNYNSADDCKKCIGYLLRQQGVQQEIIVVDNCSRDEEKRAIELFCQENGITFIANSINSGYNAGNNVGLRYAAEQGYEYALIANPDMEFPQPNYIDKLLQPMIAENDIVVCGSDIVTPEGVHQNPKKREKERLANYFRWITDFFTSKKENIPQWIETPHESRDCRCLNGCCLAIRISFAQEIGFFDEGTFLYGEESILGAQVEDKGKRMHYYAGTQAIHNHKKSKEGSRAFCLKHWRHSMVHGMQKYSKMPRYKKVCARIGIESYFFILKISYIIKNIK